MKKIFIIVLFLTLFNGFLYATEETEKKEFHLSNVLDSFRKIVETSKEKSMQLIELQNELKNKDKIIKDFEQKIQKCDKEREQKTGETCNKETCSKTIIEGLTKEFYAKKLSEKFKAGILEKAEEEKKEAENYEKEGEHIKADLHYKNAINIYKKANEPKKVENLEKILRVINSALPKRAERAEKEEEEAENYEKKGDFPNAGMYYLYAINDYESAINFYKNNMLDKKGSSKEKAEYSNKVAEYSKKIEEIRNKHLTKAFDEKLKAAILERAKKEEEEAANYDNTGDLFSAKIHYTDAINDYRISGKEDENKIKDIKDRLEKITKEAKSECENISISLDKIVPEATVKEKIWQGIDWLTRLLNPLQT